VGEKGKLSQGWDLTKIATGCAPRAAQPSEFLGCFFLAPRFALSRRVPASSGPSPRFLISCNSCALSRREKGWDTSKKGEVKK